MPCIIVYNPTHIHHDILYVTVGLKLNERLKAYTSATSYSFTFITRSEQFPLGRAQSKGPTACF